MVTTPKRESDVLGDTTWFWMMLLFLVILHADKLGEFLTEELRRLSNHQD